VFRTMQCGPYRFKTAKEQSVERGSSQVDYDALVDDESKALLEVKLPSVMKKTGELLPPHGIEFKWVCSQSLVPKILSKVSALFRVRYNICFTTIPAGRIVPGLEINGMAVSFLPQLLNRVPADDHPCLAYSSESLSKTHRSLFELSSEPFYPLSRMFLSSVARTVQIWNLTLSRKKTAPYLKMTLTMIWERIGVVQAEGPPPATRNREDENTESELIVRPFLGRYLLLGLLIYS
jgi:hypothetical protein